MRPHQNIRRVALILAHAGFLYSPTAISSEKNRDSLPVQASNKVQQSRLEISGYVYKATNSGYYLLRHRNGLEPHIGVNFLNDHEFKLTCISSFQFCREQKFSYIPARGTGRLIYDQAKISERGEYQKRTALTEIFEKARN